MTKKEAIELIKHGNPQATNKQLKDKLLNSVKSLLEPYEPYPQGVHYGMAMRRAVAEVAGIPAAFKLNMNTVEALLTWCGYE